MKIELEAAKEAVKELYEAGKDLLEGMPDEYVRGWEEAMTKAMALLFEKELTDIALDK